MVKILHILPEIWPYHRISNKNKGINLKLLTYTQYTTLTYTSSPYTPTRTEEENYKTQKQENTNSIFNLPKRGQEQIHTYTHTRYIQERRIHFLTYIYREEERNIYQVGLVVSKPISTQPQYIYTYIFTFSFIITRRYAKYTTAKGYPGYIHIENTHTYT